jgi:hypothetical protein
MIHVKKKGRAGAVSALPLKCFLKTLGTEAQHERIAAAMASAEDLFNRSSYHLAKMIPDPGFISRQS